MGDQAAHMAKAVYGPDRPRPAELMPEEVPRAVVICAVGHHKRRQRDAIAAGANRPADLIIIRQSLAERRKAADFRKHGFSDRNGRTKTWRREPDADAVHHSRQKLIIDPHRRHSGPETGRSAP